MNTLISLGEQIVIKSPTYLKGLKARVTEINKGDEDRIYYAVELLEKPTTAGCCWKIGDKLDLWQYEFERQQSP